MFTLPDNHEYHDAEFSILCSKIAQGRIFPYFSIPGKGQADVVPSHNKAFYSFDLGNIHFLSLDLYRKDEGFYPLDSQVQWMKRDLETNQSKEWICILTSSALYNDNHNSDKEKELIAIRENFFPILERYNVDIVLWITNMKPGEQKSKKISVRPCGDKTYYTVSDEKACVKTQFEIETW